jgi:deoxyribose-phosphate aldolase
VISNVVQARPPLARYEDLAKMIDHALVRPELSDDEVIAGCEVARKYDVASVSVRPCDVEIAVRVLTGSAVKVGSLAGFPHGSSTTAVKLYEARDVLRRGAREIDMVLNIAKLRSRQFQYVETELLQMAETCHKEGALLKVIFENAWLTDELKIVACRICGRAGVDFAKTSTGFAPSGYTVEDLRLMRAHLPESVGLKAAVGVSTLEKAKEVYEAGCTRFGATATASILDAWRAELSPADADLPLSTRPPSTTPV